jgi:hypothetical protein
MFKAHQRKIVKTNVIFLLTKWVTQDGSVGSIMHTPYWQ